jgi:hypothetical protein
MVLNIFASYCLEKLFKFLLASMKTLTNSRYRKPHQNLPPPIPQQDWQQLKGNWEPQFSLLKSQQSIIRLL